jgi:hypothetical protein
MVTLLVIYFFPYLLFHVASVLQHLQESLDPCPRLPAPAFAVFDVQFQDEDAALFHLLVEEELVVAILPFVAEDLGDDPVNVVRFESQL